MITASFVNKNKGFGNVVQHYGGSRIKSAFLISLVFIPIAVYAEIPVWKSIFLLFSIISYYLFIALTFKFSQKKNYFINYLKVDSISNSLYLNYTTPFFLKNEEIFDLSKCDFEIIECKLNLANLTEQKLKIKKNNQLIAEVTDYQSFLSKVEMNEFKKALKSILKI